MTVIHSARALGRSVLATSLATALALATAAPATYAQAAAPAPPRPAAQTPAPAAAPGTLRLPRGAQRVTSVEGITEYRLANGLQVLLFPDPSKQTITVNVTYKVGSRHEDYGETGMAHLLEHLVFKGTPKHPNIPQELTERGTRPNGSTWTDRTNYFETFTATEDNLRWALDLEADRMVNSFIAKKDLDSEMTVVRNELERGDNDPTNALMERVMSTAYLWHNYGKSTIGARSDLENVPIERLQAFYRTYYQPDNAVLLVAGRFDEQRTLDLVGQYFGVIPRPTRALRNTYTAEPTQDGERSVTVRRVGDVQWAMSSYHVPSGADPEFAALDLVTMVLGDTPSGRLHKALVETKRASQIFGGNMQFHDPGIAYFAAQVRTDASLDNARDGLIQTVEQIAANPPTAEEIERARTTLLTGIELGLNSAERVGLQISEWIGMGDWRLLFLHRDRLKTATVEDARKVAAKYFKPANRTMGLFIPTAQPDRAEIAPRPDVSAMLKGYTGSAVVAVGEAFDPSTANVESRTSRSTLPGGLKLSLLPKKTRGATVVANLTLRFGDETSLKGQARAAQMAGGMLMRGSARHTRQQISDEFDKLKARANVGGAGGTATASVETTRENLPAVLRLVAEVLREPAFPADEFEQLRQQRLAGLEESKSEPQTIAVQDIQRYLRTFPRDDIRYIATTDESIADLRAVTLDDAKRFYTEFYGASNGELSVVGDFDPAEITKLATDLLGSWKSPKAYARLSDSYRDVTPVNRTFETPDKSNAFFIAGLNLNIRDDDPEYAALVLGNYMLGGGFLNSRLATRIRQKDGLSYSVASQLQASSLDKNGNLLVFAIYAPQNAAKLEAAVKEEIARALREGFTDDEVKAAKAGWLQTQQVTRAQDGSLAGRLNNLNFLNRTATWDGDFEKRVGALTPADIRSALTRHIDPEKISFVKAGDFAKAAQAPTPTAPR
ncbi:MAG TPA: pitrilysin family protein [Vicinamibacterales bacterium]